VVARDNALQEPLDRSQQRLKRTYRVVLKVFDRDSKSARQDALRIRKIVLKLNKAHPDDDAMQQLLHGSVDAFLAELQTDIDAARRRVDVLGDENRRRGRAQKSYDTAVTKMADCLGQTDSRLKARRVVGVELRSRRAALRAERALEDQEGLTAHEKAFLQTFENGYEDATTCITCHETAGTEMLASGHYNWQGVSENIVGAEAEVHGKTDLINNFCIAILSNEGRCTQCHPGYGWRDKSFDFDDPSKIDCLICHDTTGTYAKDLKTAGVPPASVDLQDVALSVGKPGRKNCGDCHFKAGGGDNVKHGDLSTLMVSPTRDADVHMGTDGGDMACQRCHTSTDHKIAGMPLHSQDEGRADCTDCHSPTVHSDSKLNDHVDRVACQTCHIPTFARGMPTKLEWYWDEAGQDVDPIPRDQYGMALYDKKKGRFVYGKDVVPELLWSNGKWNRVVLHVNDTYTQEPFVLASPVGDKTDPTAKIYPFKKMIGRQPADADQKRVIVPHLFGMGPGPNPFWGKFDWPSAIAEGAAYAGQPYSGNHTFVNTVMYLSINHEIAPKENARSCDSCHDGGIDFTQLGYSGDPALGGK
jgi:octaheme c-type cytochrome (tetrathionate reductase family)